jgi:N-acyl-D-aspartate/D-glutamate deacylase
VTYDTIIRNGRWFDGTGAPSAIRNIGIRDGHLATISPHQLDATECPNVIDAADKWVLPGLLDIHTHYDIEVLGGPSLAESLRHGVTTVMLGSCSLSTIHVGGVDAGDLFSRVEAIPREYVIAAVDKHKTWSNCTDYIEALEALPLGPNLAAFIGHSDIRTATMGLDRATRKDQRPNRFEQAQMERMLGEALEAGFVGMSSMQLLFDKIDGDTCRSRTLPSTYAKPRELRRLKALLRRRGRILQSGPDIENPLNVVSQVFQSLGLFRNTLKTSLLSAADVKSNPFAVQLWHRDFFDAEIVDCPDAAVIGRSFGQVGLERGAIHPVDAFLDLVLEHGRALRWRTTISNHRPDVLKRLAGDPGVQMGFSDAGAHLRNMAFYNMGLRLLRHVRDAQHAGTPFMTIEQAVHRLTGELADWCQLDAGHLRVGDRADVVVLDPAKLDDRLDGYAEAPVDQYGGLSRMVNRNDDTVSAVLVGGRAVFHHGLATDLVGIERTGSFLRAGQAAPAPAQKGEFADVN